MGSLLNEEFGVVKAKHWSEAALQRWFRFMRRTYQEKLKVVFLVLQSVLLFVQGKRPIDYTVPEAEEVQPTGSLCTFSRMHRWMINMISYICEKLRAAVLFVQGMQPRVYTVPEEPSDNCTGPEEPSDCSEPEEVEATGFQTEELVVENVSRQVISDSIGPEEVEATEELVLLPRESEVPFPKVVEDDYPEVKCVYTCLGRKSYHNLQEEVEAKKCEFLGEVKNHFVDVIHCCSEFVHELMGCCFKVPREKVKE